MIISFILRDSDRDMPEFEPSSIDAMKGMRVLGKNCILKMTYGLGGLDVYGEDLRCGVVVDNGKKGRYIVGHVAGSRLVELWWGGFWLLI
jgi:hypothetical protein